MVQSNFGIPYATKTGGNGGVNFYEQRVTRQKWAKPDPVRRTTDCLIAAGLVIKEGTFLTLDANLNAFIPSNGLKETKWVFSGSIASGKTITFTSNVSGFQFVYTVPSNMTAAEAFLDVTKNSGFISLLNENNVAYILDMSTLFYKQNSPSLSFNADSLNVTITSNDTNLIVTNAHTAQTSTTSFPKVYGLMAFDVCAFDSAGNPVATPASMFVSGSRYSESINWTIHANSEYLADAWGVLHAVSPFDTGVTNMIAANAFCVQSDFEIRETREV